MSTKYNTTLRKKDNAWQVIVSYKTSSGKWRQKSKQGFSQRWEAKLYAEELLKEIKSTAQISNEFSHLTLAEFSAIYLKDNESNLSYNSIQAIEYATKFLGDEITSKLVKDITALELMKKFSNPKYSYATKKMYKALLSIIFNYAISPYKIIATNPLADLSLIKAKPKERALRVYTKEEINTLFANLKEVNYKLYIQCCLGYYCGLRYGEVLGLSWNDIDLENNLLTVKRQLALTGKNKYELKETKTQNSFRTVPIPPNLHNILKEYKEVAPQLTTRLLFKASSSNTNYISNYIRKFVKNKSFHDLRHTYATTLLSNGVDIKTVAALLGDTMQTVINNYIHFTEEMRQRAATYVANIFG